MRGAVLYEPRDIRFEDRPEPKIIEPADAILTMAVSCVYGSDLAGATATNGMTHIAIQEQLDGKVVEWMEQVSDEQYQAGLTAE